MMTNFDCSAYFVRDVGDLLRTFEILPEYLKTAEGDRVDNYRDWGIPLGRRFRALKLWFVIRSYGLAGLRAIVRGHIEMAKALAREMADEDDFEILAPPTLSLFCFRYHPPAVTDPGELDRLNQALLERLNAGGSLYLTHTRVGDVYAIRFCIGQTGTAQRHVDAAWRRIRDTARSPGLDSPPHQQGRMP